MADATTRELAKLMSNPRDYESHIFNDDFMLATKVNPPEEFEDSVDAAFLCCAHVLDSNGVVGRCRRARKNFNRYCCGHFKELASAQYRAKKLEKAAIFSGEAEDVYKFALQRLMIIRKFFRPGTPCERDLKGHIQAILFGAAWERVRELAASPTENISSTREDEGDAAVQNHQVEDEFEKVSVKVDPPRTRVRADLPDVLIVMTNIMRSIPTFEPIDFAMELPIYENVQFPAADWYLFTSREINYIYDEDLGRRRKPVNLFTHHVSFLVLELDYHVLIVCVNRHEPNLRRPTARVKGILIPEFISSINDYELEESKNKILECPLTDLVGTGNAFAFDKTENGLRKYHDNLCELLETKSRRRGLDTITTRFPVEFQRGSGVAVHLTNDEKKFKSIKGICELGVPGNRVPKIEMLRTLGSEGMFVTIMDIDIQLDTRNTTSLITSRNWIKASEKRVKINEWKKEFEQALAMHGAD